MSIAIFAMRKMFLTLKVSNLNFSLMQLMRSESALAANGGKLGAYLQQAETNGAKNQQQSIFMQQARGQEQMIKRAQDSLTYQKNQIETQLKMAQQEIESVTKGEDNAIKQGTPKYGLA